MENSPYRIIRSDGLVEIYRQSEANARIYARAVLDGYRAPGVTYTLEKAVNGEWVEVTTLRSYEASK